MKSIQYALHQMHLSNSSSEATLDTKRSMMMDFRGDNIAYIAKGAFDEGLYNHVANISGENLHDVFEIGNIGPEDKISRLDRMSSVSVGDIIIDSFNGNKFVVANHGFKAVA
jgi:hypothetical protein